MPWHMQCEDTDKNRKCKILLNSTTTSRPLVTVSPTSKPAQTSGSGVTTIPSGDTEVSMTIRKSVAATSDSSHNTHDVMYGLVGVSSVLVPGAIVCAAVKLKGRNGSRNRRRIGTIYSSIEQGNNLLHFPLVYLSPFLCAAFSLSSISWAPTQLIPFPQKMPELGSWWLYAWVQSHSYYIWI